MAKLSMSELQRLSVEEFSEIQKLPIVVVLDNIRSGLNVGSIFRTCDAFLIEKIILCGITAQPPHREIQKTALGATETVKFEYFQSVKESIIKLKSEGFIILGVEQTTESVNLENFKWDKNKPIALIVGNEVDGISDEILNDVDAFIEIPQFGTKHSLNVAVCTGIVLWEILKAYKID